MTTQAAQATTPANGSAFAVPASWLTPKLARTAPIHRWFVFPHSYAPHLASRLLDELAPSRDAVVLDPFCGAGTTLVEAQRRGMEAWGIDLLPLSVLASRAKTDRPDISSLIASVEAALNRVDVAQAARPPGDLLRRALTPTTYGRLSAALEGTDDDDAALRCVRVAILGLVGRCSRLRADGGWLRACTPDLRPKEIASALRLRCEFIANDLREGHSTPVHVIAADARDTPLHESSVDLVVTSPPYPNRHDYTRVFGVELELGWRLRERVKLLRYEAIHSHPEARPTATCNGYREPRELNRLVKSIADDHPDPRIPRMVSGYFRDLYLVLGELRRVVRPGGRLALVVGNVRYCGVEVPVDDLLASVGAQAGLEHERKVTLRRRGNSAQQMGRFGRHESRESVVILRRS